MNAAGDGASGRRPAPGRMPRAVLGRSGLEVSVLGWGGAGTSGDASAGTCAEPSEMEAIWDTYGAHGGNFIDTAPSYGSSEDLIGRHLAHRRSEFILATKSHPVDADQTMRDVEQSLRRMKTDVIDLLYAPHGCWEEERLSNCFKKGGVIEGALKAREHGLARHLAFSFDYFQSLDIRRLRELIDTDLFEVVQMPYCLVQVEPVDQETIPFAREKGMGIIANFPTLSGLTGREWGVFHADFAGLADTPGQATLLAILCHPDIHCVLTKFSSVPRCLENCAAGCRVGSMDEGARAGVRRRVEARGQVRFLQRDSCPPAPPGVAFRHGMIYFDLFTRFGFGGARGVVEDFLRQVDGHPDYPWTGEGRAAIEEVRRACPVYLT